MADLTRRGFGQLLGLSVAATAAVGLAESAGVAPAQAAAARTNTISDVQHVVILMQENRSFDHYFGSLQGVRGFADRSTIDIDGSYSVFNQPNGSARQYPWPFGTASASGASGETVAQFEADLDHAWADQHAAWNGGKMDSWVAAKGDVRTMGYLTRTDIPFHYALADAYTICDNYFCSTLSATGPNRTYLWSGMIDPAAKNGGPAYDYGEESGLTWQTYAEALQNAGVSWKVYQNAKDNFTDNALDYFTQFHTAPHSSVLWQRGEASVPSTGNTPTDIANAIRNDVVNGTLPQVSWIVASQDYSEHPSAAPQNGAHFIDLVMQALAANATVLNSTVLILNYDENDGLFDHVPPPVPPAGTASEFILSNTPIGLGFRVPMIVASPWTRGGYVSSQTFDHTSVIQFLETWTKAIGKSAVCTNISAWRRLICGDLTSVFDFTSYNPGLPSTIPSTESTLTQPANGYSPKPVSNTMPTQETGTRPARPIPCQPDVYAIPFTGTSTGTQYLNLQFSNNGAVATHGVHLATYVNANRSGGPWQYSLGPSSGSSATETDFYNIGAGYGSGKYDFTVVGPNRFLRHFTGNAATASTKLEAVTSYAIDTGTGKLALWFTMTNSGTAAVTFTITSNQYRSDGPWTYTVPAGGSVKDDFNCVANQHGWYDFTVTVSADPSWSRRVAGHLEVGTASVTG